VASSPDVDGSIEGLQVLRGLSARVTRRVAAAAVTRRYPRRAVLFRSGDAPAALHFVLSGRVRVARRVDHGSSVLHFEQAGGVLGEIPVFGGGPAHAGEPHHRGRITTRDRLAVRRLSA
jgi:CRP-like cAMP-binding protein